MAYDKVVLVGSDRSASANPRPASDRFRSQLYWGWALVVLFIAPIAFIELMLAVSPRAWAYLIYFVAAASMHHWLLATRVATPTKVIQVSAIAVCLGILHFVRWNSRKVFLARFERVQPGMTMAEVDDLLACCSLDARANHGDANQRGYHHSVAPRFDSDVGIVHFEDGRVTRREFLPD